MYSRKYIRSPAVASSIQRILPTTGGGELSSPPKAEERSVTLPPDYNGMAFSGSGKGSVLQDPGDYPETLIPPLAEEGSVTDAPVADGQTETVEPVSARAAEAVPITEGDLSPAEPAVTPEMAEPSVEPVTDEWREAVQESLQSAQSEPSLQSAQFAQSAPSPQSAAIPLLTPELLRSLTLEDLLLFWMLLMLTVSNQEDQIYLLLGLLLFQR